MSAEIRIHYNWDNERSYAKFFFGGGGALVLFA